MRPASNEDEVTIGDTVLYTRSSSFGGPWSEWIDSGHPGCASYWNRSIYPQTIVNPIQPDGTRGRSPWINQFASLPVPWRNILVQNDTPWGVVHQYKSLTGVLPDNGNIKLAVNMVSPYCAHGVEFPYELEARARTSFLKKLAASTADLGVALAEARQTIDLTRNLAQDIVHGIDKAVKAGRGLPKQVVREILNFGTMPKRFPRERASAYNKRIARERAVLNKWLEYQFGLVPLVNDIHEIGQGLSDMLFEQSLPMRMTIVSGSKLTIPGNGVASSGVFPSCDCEVRGEAEYFCHISADYDIPLSGSRSWNQWGMANPASVVWNVTQFSWLCDYAFQVGDWLETLTASNGTVPLGGSLSRMGKLTSLQTRLVGSSTTTVLQPEGWTPIPVSNVGVFQRDLIGAVDPALRPTVRNKLNLTRLANVLSVLALRRGLH